MQVERRALYNSLRMNWLQDSTLKVKNWQVEDYRKLPTEKLFEKLAEKGMPLDRQTFNGFADNAASPEELTDDLLADQSFDVEAHDQIYLVVFELWRRLLPERLCLSIFCDELDHQIFLYDKGDERSSEAIPDMLAQLEVVLDENADEGVDPADVFETVCSGCANDVESFIYDFIALQIDNQNDSYASELLEEFEDYIRDVKWFDFLRARLLMNSDSEAGNLEFKRLVHECVKNPDLEFQLELLASMTRSGDQSVFAALVKQSLPLLKEEGDFQDLLGLCADFYHLLDKENEEQELMKIIKSRSKVPYERGFNRKDPDVAQFERIIRIAK